RNGPKVLGMRGTERARELDGGERGEDVVRDEPQLALVLVDADLRVAEHVEVAVPFLDGLLLHPLEAREPAVHEQPRRDPAQQRQREEQADDPQAHVREDRRNDHEQADPDDEPRAAADLVPFDLHATLRTSSSAITYTWSPRRGRISAVPVNAPNAGSTP